MMTVIEQKEIELSQPQARLLPVDQYFSENTKKSSKFTTFMSENSFLCKEYFYK